MGKYRVLDIKQGVNIITTAIKKSKSPYLPTYQKQGLKKFVDEQARHLLPRFSYPRWRCIKYVGYLPPLRMTIGEGKSYNYWQRRN
jgi:hypothetical protein